MPCKKCNIGDEYNPGICWSGVSCSAAIGRGATQLVADSGVSWMSALISITTQRQRFTGHSRHTAPLRTTCSPAHRPERRRHGTASFAQYSTQPGPEAARDVICLPWCMAVQQTHTAAVCQLFSQMSYLMSDCISHHLLKYVKRHIQHQTIIHRVWKKWPPKHVKITLGIDFIFLCIMKSHQFGMFMWNFTTTSLSTAEMLLFIKRWSKIVVANIAN